MKKKPLLLISLILLPFLSGCQRMDAGKLLQSGVQAFQVATISDAKVKALSNQACAEMDSINHVAPANNQYAKRLEAISKMLGNNIDGTPVNYKVYLTKNVNAWAMANGCIRVYSGLMDMMNDNEIVGILGHELGHVALGHSRKAIQVAYAATAARTAISASSDIGEQLSQSQLADLGELLVHAQFSQKQEIESDDYAFDLLKKRHINLQGLVTSFDKLNSLSVGRESSMFDSHPPTAERVQNIRKRIATEK